VKDTLELLKKSISRVEDELGLDSRFSFSRITAQGSSELSVELSRNDVMQRLAAVLEDFDDESQSSGSINLRSPTGIGVKLELLGGRSDSLLWVTSSVADLRKEPDHAAELLNQAIMGETAAALVKEGDWYLARLGDGYLGWIRSWYVAEEKPGAVDAYLDEAEVIVESNVAYVLSEPMDGSLPISDIVAGSPLVVIKTDGAFRKVRLPRGKVGYIRGDAIGDPPRGKPDGGRILARAKRFLGIPYLWGGTSAKGFDCSGLVKRVFGIEGIELPRDSDLQSRIGRLISKKMIGEKASPGDLLFFGEGKKISHVAIWIGDGRFIHSQGEVRINSLDENDSQYEENLAKSLLYARSVLS
jgi:hypothetical protein